MANKPLPFPEVLRQLLRYDPRSGNLFWRPRERKDCFSDQQFKCFRAKHAGRLADSKGPNGYNAVFLYVEGRKYRYQSHRVIWAMHYGKWPESIIDHINGKRSDNRLENLRLSNKQRNSQNAKLHRSNTSGFVGVSKVQKTNKWCARMSANGRNIYLGTFEKIEDAAKAAREARLASGFDVNHGRKE